MLHEGEPGVEVVTPLLVPGATTAILVNRGWLPADDAATARPQDHPEPGEQTIEGVAEAMKRGAGPPGPRALTAPGGAAAGAPAGDSVALFTVRWLDADSIAPRLPYPIAAYVLRQRPGVGVPGLPRRSVRPLYDATMHLSYAIQWFLFAVLIPGGTAALAWSRRRRAQSRPMERTSCCTPGTWHRAACWCSRSWDSIRACPAPPTARGPWPASATSTGRERCARVRPRRPRSGIAATMRGSRTSRPPGSSVSRSGSKACSRGRARSASRDSRPRIASPARR